MQLFSADAIKKNFDPKNCPQKLLTIGPPIFFFSTGPAAQTAQNRNPVPPKAP